MNVKRFVWASIAVFVAFEIIDTVVHMVILRKTYEALAPIWRPEMTSLSWIFPVCALIMAFLFVYIFIKGYENKGIMEGVRYGIIIGLFISIPYGFCSYAMYPLPFSLCLQWFIYSMITYIIGGIIAAAIYQSKRARVPKTKKRKTGRK